MRKMIVAMSFMSFLITSVLTVSIWALPEKFFEVSPGIYRSAQPSKKDIQQLKDYGIKTILILNNDDDVVRSELKAAKKAGLNVIEQPMSGFWTPDDVKVDEILATLNDPSYYPILIHCKHGEDRTGLMIGLHRVFAEGWTSASAYDEMLDYGFHPSLFKLDNYYKSVTATSPEQ